MFNNNWGIIAGYEFSVKIINEVKEKQKLIVTINMKTKSNQANKMSLKKYFIFCLAISLMTATGLHAQMLSGGITAGVSTGSAKIYDIPGGLVNVIKGNNIMGFNAGVFAKLDLSPFFIKPQLLLNYRYGSLDIYIADAIVSSKDFSMEKIEIPLLFGFKVLGPLNIEAGPVYNYILHSTNDFNGNNVKITKSGLGYRAGVSADLGKLNLFIHYQGITNKTSGSTDVSTIQSPYELVFGLGFDLGKK